MSNLEERSRRVRHQTHASCRRIPSVPPGSEQILTEDPDVLNLLPVGAN